MANSSLESNLRKPMAFPLATSMRSAAVATGMTLFFFATPAIADVSIAQDGDRITVAAQDGTVGKVSEHLENHFNMEITGDFDREIPINGEVSGSLTDVLNKLIGANNYILEYKDDKPARLVVLKASPNSDLAQPSSTQAAVTGTGEDEAQSPAAQAYLNPTTPTQAAEKAAAEKEAKLAEEQNGENAAPVSSPEYNQQIVNITRLQAQQFGGGQFKPRQNRSNRPPIDKNGNLNPDVSKQMAQDATRQLESLVKALKSLCPPGQECN